MLLRSRRIVENPVFHAYEVPISLVSEIIEKSMVPAETQPYRKRKYEEICSEEFEHVAKRRRVETALTPAPVYVLVFDVETTGLVYEKTPLDQYPYITQISMIVFDIRNKKIVRTYNQYIKLPAGIEIPEIVTKITGITREMCDEHGVSIIDALKTFYNEYCGVRTVIAHNIDFDRRVLMGEFYRNRAHPELLARAPHWENFHVFRGLLEPRQKPVSKKRTTTNTKTSFKRDGELLDVNTMRKMYCTMKESQFLCMIRMKNGGIKYPKLIETFRHFFPNEPEPQNLHNSMIDTLICLRCFVMMKWREDIAKTPESGYTTTV